MDLIVIKVNLVKIYGDGVIVDIDNMIYFYWFKKVVDI